MAAALAQSVTIHMTSVLVALLSRVRPYFRVLAENQSSRGFGKKAMIGGLLGALGLGAGVAAADMTDMSSAAYSRWSYDQPSETWSSFAYQPEGMAFGIDVQGKEDKDSLSGFLYGSGTIRLANLGEDTKDLFQFEIVEPSLQLPDGFLSQYERGDNLLTLLGSINPGDSYDINFTFDPAKVVFGRTNFHYEGRFTSGDIPKADTISVVPLPGAFLMGILGLGAAGFRLRRGI